LTVIALSNLPTLNAAATFAKGADTSWLPQMESNGYTFYNDSGAKTDCLQILKDHGINSIRVRVFVNPSNDKYNGHCSTTEAIALATRAKNLGMRIMIDLHYSDSWADPAQQNKPAAWSSLSFNDLMAKVWSYSRDTMQAFKNAGITPEWVQVGNETSNGMLWPDGKASTNMQNFTYLINSGSDGVKAVFSSTKVIVHLPNGQNDTNARWIFDGLKNNGGRWDICGFSLYPPVGSWSSYNTQCLATMNDMVSRYGKEVMLCEIGYQNDKPADCKSFVQDIITKTKSVSSSKGIGVFYWEPQSVPSWNNYILGCWDSTTKKPTVGLDGFIP
jgi:arabinogalactan endo-1,4-beta-galactosidase